MFEEKTFYTVVEVKLKKQNKVYCPEEINYMHLQKKKLKA